MNFPLFIALGGLLLWPLQGMARGVLKRPSVKLRFAPDLKVNNNRDPVVNVKNVCDAGGVPLESTCNVPMVLLDKTVAGSSQIINKIALLPGTPQFFAGKQLGFVIDYMPQRLDCK